MFCDFFDYHQKTKHSYFSVRSNPNRIDWNNPPERFKPYGDVALQTIKLDLENETHRLIYFSAAVTAQKTYPGVSYYLRVNPSAGALYPNELYFQVRNTQGLLDGIYHYDVASNNLELLSVLGDNGVEPYFGFQTQHNGIIILVSSVYYRSSWKYKNRALRYCLLDAGHLLGSLESSLYLQNKSYNIYYDFDKEGLNEQFGFDNGEFFTAAMSISFETKKEVESLDIHIPFVNPTGDFQENKMIEEAYKESLEIKNKVPQTAFPSFNYNKSVFEEVILQRRSIRAFTQGSISKREFESVVSILEQPITSDCDEQVNIYYVLNRVEGMPLGVYTKGEYIKEGDFQHKAGYLCLEQDLGHQSAVTLFLTSTSGNYQALYQKAGIIGQRLYLIANYLGYGCSGIGAYYDDEVVEFIEENQMILYAMAIGK